MWFDRSDFVPTCRDEIGAHTSGRELEGGGTLTPTLPHQGGLTSKVNLSVGAKMFCVVTPAKAGAQKA